MWNVPDFVLSSPGSCKKQADFLGHLWLGHLLFVRNTRFKNHQKPAYVGNCGTSFNVRGEIWLNTWIPRHAQGFYVTPLCNPTTFHGFLLPRSRKLWQLQLAQHGRFLSSHCFLQSLASPASLFLWTRNTCSLYFSTWWYTYPLNPIKGKQILKCLKPTTHSPQCVFLSDIRCVFAFFYLVKPQIYLKSPVLVIPDIASHHITLPIRSYYTLYW